jgi:DNA polymerase I-like protein with 3'-5' exonuclease and polymerase domains
MASTESSYWTGLQIQNIPAKGGVKEYIEADEGWQLAENDYSQSEARCVGYLSGCMELINLVESDKDYHKWNAHKFFGVPYAEITPALRQLAKRVGHGANYNMGATVLLETMGPQAVAEARILLKLPAKWTLVQVCQHLLKTYEDAYPEVKKDWYDSIKRLVKLSKKLVSPLGWTRFFFGDPSSNKQALNAAVAHAPQNLSVSIINVVFYRLWHDSVYGDLLGKLRLKAQVHDSLLYCYRGDDVPSIVSTRMQEPLEVTDCNGVKRTMLIPNDCSKGGTSWASLK